VNLKAVAVHVQISHEHYPARFGARTGRLKGTNR
jgi:hypothetical protein